MDDLQYRLLHALVEEVCLTYIPAIGSVPTDNAVKVLREAFDIEYTTKAEAAAVKALRIHPDYKDKLDSILG